MEGKFGKGEQRMQGGEKERGGVRTLITPAIEGDIDQKLATA